MKTIEFKAKVENGIIKVPKQYMISNQKVKIAIFDKELSEKEILHIGIDNKLKHFFTVSALQNYLEQQLQFLLMDSIKSSIDTSIIESGADNDLIMEKSREQAWDTYKDFFLQGVKLD